MVAGFGGQSGGDGGFVLFRSESFGRAAGSGLVSTGCIGIGGGTRREEEGKIE